jgi:hypothetical protein
LQAGFGSWILTNGSQTRGLSLRARPASLGWRIGFPLASAASICKAAIVSASNRQVLAAGFLRRRFPATVHSTARYTDFHVEITFLGA